MLKKFSKFLYKINDSFFLKKMLIALKSSNLFTCKYIVKNTMKNARTLHYEMLEDLFS